MSDTLFLLVFFIFAFFPGISILYVIKGKKNWLFSLITVLITAALIAFDLHSAYSATDFHGAAFILQLFMPLQIFSAILTLIIGNIVLLAKKDNSGKIIGTGVVPEKNKYLFEEAPQEFLVAIGGGSAYGSRVDGKFSVSFPILGYVNLETGKKSDVNANLSFVPTKEEEENNEYFNVFDKLKIYRIKAMAPKRVEGDAMVNNEFRMSSLYALELLESNVSDEFLEGLIEKYNAPVVAKSELLGEFVLDKDLDVFCGKCDWLGDEANASINVEEGQETVDEGIKCLEAFYNDRTSWDKKMREYAAGELTDLANEWQSSDCDVDEDGEPINFEELTEEDFASRLEISLIEMGVDGNFTVYYDDGDMFFGHSIVVEGSLNEGVNYADMMG